MSAVKNPGSAGVFHSEATQCFHCGLDCDNETEHSTSNVKGQLRNFCCPGCQAVCEAIYAAGLEDFYQYQNAAPDSEVSAPDMAAIFQRLRLYEREEISEKLIHRVDGHAEISLYLENIRCAACIWLNEKHLRQLDGVIAVHADFATHRMRVEWDQNQISLHDVLVAIASIGYIAHPFDASLNQQLEKQRQQRSAQKLVFAGVFGMMLMQFSLATYLLNNDSATLPAWENYGRWSGLVIAFLILAYPGREFFSGAWRDSLNRQISMDLPIAIGLTTAWFGSLHATYTGRGEVYLDSIAMFVFFILLSRFWENRSRLNASAQLNKLSIQQDVPVHLLEQDEIRDIVFSELKPGHKIRVFSGEQIPADGLLLTDQAVVNESLLSGESEPVYKNQGAKLLAGSLNLENNLDLEVSQIGADSYLGQLARLAQKGLEQKPHMVYLANQVASWFVPAILTLAGFTALFWWSQGSPLWLQHTVAVLIVSCPCALALAIPVAMTVSAATLVARGIVPLRMAAIEPLASLKYLIFDKTGTLTEGHYEVVEEQLNTAQFPAEMIRSLAKSAALQSQHPAARALKHYLSEVQTIELSHTQNLSGQGVEFEWQTSLWRLGHQGFVTDISSNSEAVSWIKANQDLAPSSEIYLGNQAGILARFSLNDGLREDAVDTVQGLKAQGHEIHILSGDRSSVVEHVAKTLGVRHSHAQQSPEQKLSYIQQLKQQGRTLMVGDGINDAPTLAAADAAISIRSATDLARSSSDFVLLKDRLEQIPVLLDTSRRTVKTMRQNLLWALGYNLIAIPMAIAGWIPPWGAALGMSLSSFIVVLNANRLRK